MEAETRNELVITLSDQNEINAFSTLIFKLKNKPSKVGFNKSDLTDEEWEMVEMLYSLFTYE